MASVDIEAIIEIEAPPDAVWRTMVDGALAWRWLGAYGFAARIGQGFLIQPSARRRETLDFDGAILCQVEVLEPNRRLRFRWTYPDRPSTEVTFTLTQIPGGTHVRLTHADWEAFEDELEPADVEAALQALADNWANEVLPALKAMVEG